MTMYLPAYEAKTTFLRIKQILDLPGNKMTIKMSVANPAYHDIVVYVFQDQDNTQMHLYMPTSSFEKFFANASVHIVE